MGTLLLTLSEETTTRSQDVRETSRHIQDQQGPGEVQTEGRRGGQYNQKTRDVFLAICVWRSARLRTTSSSRPGRMKPPATFTKGAHVEKFLEEMGDAITL